VRTRTRWLTASPVPSWTWRMRKAEDPRIAVEVLIGHGMCHIIAETSVHIPKEEVRAAVRRIAGDVETDYKEVPQDVHLADNQKDRIRCGDNGIFKGMPLTAEQKELSQIAEDVYHIYPTDGKYILGRRES
jgi:S-adenosylmethionine synthetase